MVLLQRALERTEFQQRLELAGSFQSGERPSLHPLQSGKGPPGYGGFRRCWADRVSVSSYSAATYLFMSLLILHDSPCRCPRCQQL